MLRQLIEAQGWPIYDLARATGVSATSLYRWIDEDAVPHIGNAMEVARALNSPDLLRRWGYQAAADQLESEKKTHDPNEANGWRLDTLIAEQRETNKILNRIEQHLAPKRPMPEERQNE